MFHNGAVDGDDDRMTEIEQIYIATCDFFRFMATTTPIRCDHAAHHGHANVRHKRLAAARLLYKGHRCVDGRLFDIRVRGTAGVRPRQLRIPFRYVDFRDLFEHVYYLYIYFCGRRRFSIGVFHLKRNFRKEVLILMQFNSGCTIICIWTECYLIERNEGLVSVQF